jgi:hypothetical protein
VLTMALESGRYRRLLLLEENKAEQTDSIL